MIIFILVGGITGYAFNRMKKLEEEAKGTNLIDPMTGSYNTNKLLSDLEEEF